MRPIETLAMLAVLATAGMAEAEPVDRLLAQPRLVEPGAALSYRHLRSGTDLRGTQTVHEDSIRIERDAGDGRVVVTTGAEGRPRRLAPFPGMSGNPVLMVFLESVVETASEATGGSPFYLRARIREAMRDRIAERAVTVVRAGSDMAGWELTLSPFRDDPHSGELGDFAGLALTFVLSEAVPGTFLSLAASIGGDPPAYSEEIRLDDRS